MLYMLKYIGTVVYPDSASLNTTPWYSSYPLYFCMGELLEVTLSKRTCESEGLTSVDDFVNHFYRKKWAIKKFVGESYPIALLFLSEHC
jgi:hypothetical protein